MERKFAAIKEAGFDGFTWQLDREHGELARKHGLLAIGFVSSANPGEFAGLIRQNVDGGARRINVQLGNHDTPVPESIDMAIRFLEEGEKQGVPCDIEVHRDTCTETPEKTYAIAAGYQRATGRLLPITWDFSHFAVVKHLAPPYWDRLIESPELIRHARQFHFRPFNGHHCQVPVTDGTGKLSLELQQWLPALEKLVETWLEGDQSGAELYACPEMGPLRGGYNLAQLPDSWSEAKILRGLIKDTWEKAEARRRTGTKPSRHDLIQL
ncbi:hypothetical protein [Opitutus sp. GAS368]|uniref:sugar phosphate isomerase/epimerase family protein n=1 Tax=Opitutus sp. GAS368 TaxID=1882749 RepID=UPI0018D4979B|nr:hypothetical protein [Opitutus sp. GAS368]